MGYTEAQKEATKRYNKKAYDRIDLFVQKGKRQIIKEFINEAIDKAMEEEK